MKPDRLFVTLLAAVVFVAGCAEVRESKSSEDSGSYAALAVVPGKGRMFHGYAKRETLSDARKVALSRCNNYDCTVVQEFKAGQCIHIVLGNDQIYWNQTGFTWERGQGVLDYCKRADDNCQFRVSECLR